MVLKLKKLLKRGSGFEKSFTSIGMRVKTISLKYCDLGETFEIISFTVWADL